MCKTELHNHVCITSNSLKLEGDATKQFHALQQNNYPGLQTSSIVAKIAKCSAFNSFSAGMSNTIMHAVREAEYNARYTLAAGGGEFRPSYNRP